MEQRRRRVNYGDNGDTIAITSTATGTSPIPLSATVTMTGTLQARDKFI